MQRAPETVPADVEIDTAMARRLLVEQLPEFATCELELAAMGWDNVLIRLGSAHVMRLPRRGIAAALLDTESTWLPELALWLPVRVPEPLFIGRPSAEYPYPWVVTHWIEGTVCGSGKIEFGEHHARDLGRALRVLHHLDLPGSPPENRHRRDYEALRRRDEHTRRGLRQVGGERAAHLEELWSSLVVASEGTERTWCHGDLHPFNVLVDDEGVVALLDFGDLTAGDPAVDLASVWMMSPVEHHRAFADDYFGVWPRTPAQDALWRRGQAWALAFGVLLIEAGRAGAGPDFERVGRQTLARLSA